MATKRVNTATLIRGDNYTMRHPDSTPQKPIEPLRFQDGVEQTITAPFTPEMFEDLYDELYDGEGEAYEKPRFRVARNVAEPDTAQGSSRKPTRLKADRQVKRKPIRKR